MLVNLPLLPPSHTVGERRRRRQVAQHRPRWGKVTPTLTYSIVYAVSLPLLSLCCTVYLILQELKGCTYLHFFTILARKRGWFLHSCRRKTFYSIIGSLFAERKFYTPHHHQLLNGTGFTGKTNRRPFSGCQKCNSEERWKCWLNVKCFPNIFL